MNVNMNVFLNLVDTLGSVPPGRVVPQACIQTFNTCAYHSSGERKNKTRSHRCEGAHSTLGEPGPQSHSVTPVVVGDPGLASSGHVT